MMAPIELVDQGTQGEDQPVSLIPVPSLIPSPILVGRPMQTDFMGIDTLTQTDSRKTYEISIQTDVVPELVKLRLLNDVPDTDPTKASFLGVMQKG